MKRKTTKDGDLAAQMTTIQEQLAVLDKKFDQFMTKSLNELAQVLAASKPVPVRTITVQPQVNASPAQQRPGRQMYAVVCFECGEDCEIPFKPSGNRPVYCKSCFAKRKSQAVKPNLAAPPAASATGSNNAQQPTASAQEPKTQKKAAGKKKAVTLKKSSTKKKTTPAKKASKKK